MFKEHRLIGYMVETRDRFGRINGYKKAPVPTEKKTTKNPEWEKAERVNPKTGKPQTVLVPKKEPMSSQRRAQLIDDATLDEGLFEEITGTKRTTAGKDISSAELKLLAGKLGARQDVIASGTTLENRRRVMPNANTIWAMNEKELEKEKQAGIESGDPAKGIKSLADFNGDTKAFKNYLIQKEKDGSGLGMVDITRFFDDPQGWRKNGQKTPTATDVAAEAVAKVQAQKPTPAQFIDDEGNFDKKSYDVSLKNWREDFAEAQKQAAAGVSRQTGQDEAAVLEEEALAQTQAAADAQPEANNADFFSALADMAPPRLNEFDPDSITDDDAYIEIEQEGDEGIDLLKESFAIERERLLQQKQDQEREERQRQGYAEGAARSAGSSDAFINGIRERGAAAIREMQDEGNLSLRELDVRYNQLIHTAEKDVADTLRTYIDNARTAVTEQNKEIYKQWKENRDLLFNIGKENRAQSNADRTFGLQAEKEAARRFEVDRAYEFNLTKQAQSDYFRKWGLANSTASFFVREYGSVSNGIVVDMYDDLGMELPAAFLNMQTTAEKKAFIKAEQDRLNNILKVGKFPPNAVDALASIMDEEDLVMAKSIAQAVAAEKAAARRKTGGGGSGGSSRAKLTGTQRLKLQAMGYDANAFAYVDQLPPEAAQIAAGISEDNRDYYNDLINTAHQMGRPDLAAAAAQAGFESVSEYLDNVTPAFDESGDAYDADSYAEDFPDYATDNSGGDVDSGEDDDYYLELANDYDE